MPCWPEVWEKVQRLLPTLGAGTLLLAGTAFVAFCWLMGLKRDKRARAFNVLGIISAVPVVAGWFFAVMLTAFTSGDPAPVIRNIKSPGGNIAELTYSAGFLGRDGTLVRLQRVDCCRHVMVFWHDGPSWADDPKLEWMDDHHLRISYHKRASDLDHCEKALGDITVVCTSTRWDWDTR